VSPADRQRLIAALTLALVKLSDEERERRRDATALVVAGEEIESDTDAAEAA
jgi:hypothetical protein